MLKLLSAIVFFSFVVVDASDVADIGINAFAASRSLLAKDISAGASTGPNGTLYNYQNCSLIYTRGLKVQMKVKKDGKSSTVEIADFASSSAVPKVTGDCDNSTKGPGKSVLTVTYDDVKDANITKFAMTFNFNASASGRWSLASLTVSVSCKKNTCTSFSDDPYNTAGIASERGFSYHCFKPAAIKPKDNKTIILTFNKLQVQPFNVEHGRFSHADDCVGFFSVGVWSGLFVSLLLTLIFAYGIVMINNISVTDRFDDPKGPGIQVNVQE